MSHFKDYLSARDTIKITEFSLCVVLTLLNYEIINKSNSPLLFEIIFILGIIGTIAFLTYEMFRLFIVSQ